MENSDYPYHTLDYTTPWTEFLAYAEICHQLNVQDQPSVGRFMNMRYKNYLEYCNE